MNREGDYITHPPPTLEQVESFSFVNILYLAYSLCLYTLCLYSLSLSHTHTYTHAHIIYFVAQNLSWFFTPCAIGMRPSLFFCISLQCAWLRVWLLPNLCVFELKLYVEAAVGWPYLCSELPASSQTVASPSYPPVPIYRGFPSDIFPCHYALEPTILMWSGTS